MVASAIGHLAEAAWHHPELVVTYSSIEVRLQTHDAGGITEKDFELAAKIEEPVMGRPEGGKSALTGTPRDDAHGYIRYED
jgi:pterin-4a-carbinolamine dehydratase